MMKFPACECAKQFGKNQMKYFKNIVLFVCLKKTCRSKINRLSCKICKKGHQYRCGKDYIMTLEQFVQILKKVENIPLQKKQLISQKKWVKKLLKKVSKILDKHQLEITDYKFLQQLTDFLHRNPNITTTEENEPILEAQLQAMDSNSIKYEYQEPKIEDNFDENTPKNSIDKQREKEDNTSHSAEIIYNSSSSNISSCSYCTSSSSSNSDFDDYQQNVIQNILKVQSKTEDQYHYEKENKRENPETQNDQIDIQKQIKLEKPKKKVLKSQEIFNYSYQFQDSSTHTYKTLSFDQLKDIALKFHSKNINTQQQQLSLLCLQKDICDNYIIQSKIIQTHQLLQDHQEVFKKKQIKLKPVNQKKNQYSIHFLLDSAMSAKKLASSFYKSQIELDVQLYMNYPIMVLNSSNNIIKQQIIEILQDSYKSNSQQISLIEFYGQPELMIQFLQQYYDQD